MSIRWKLLAITLLMTFSAAGCKPASDAGVTQPESLEIREYQGEKLSSVNDFRENSIRGPQKVDITAYRLSISGLVENKTSYSYEEVLKSFGSYQKLITLHCVEGWSVKMLWDGVLVKDLINNASVRQEANTVIFHAVDGYTTSLPLKYLEDNNIILAYKMNGITIPPERGFPFQLVAQDKWGYKWIKWVTEIELSANLNYRGFWERQGYSNDGSLDKPSYGR